MPPGKRSEWDRRRLPRRSLLAGLAPALVRGAGQARVVDQKGRKVSFFTGDRLLFEYCYSAERPKSYVHPFCAPDGKPLTIDGPPDHIHHRGVMLAWSAVDGFDFWGEVNPAPHGRIVLQRFEQPPRSSFAGFTSIEHWVAGGRVRLIERRSIGVPEAPPDTVWLEWASELEPASGPVTVATGGHEYNGLGIRFLRSMDRGRVLNARGTTEIRQANGEKAEWCTYYGDAGGGRTAGVAIFNHPENRRHPTPFFVMNEPFGYLSAAPTFHEAEWRLEPGEKLRLRFAVVSYFGEPEREALSTMYNNWSRRG